MANIALLIAGGSGSRMHRSVPKQFLPVEGRPVIAYTLGAFQRHPEIDAIAVACIVGWEEELQRIARDYGIDKLCLIAPGGENGQASIRSGVTALAERFAPEDLVLIHDANRPLVSARIISDNIRVAREKGCAITAIPCAEAMLWTEDGERSCSSYPRDRLRRTQTPHAFPLKDICELHRRALAAGIRDSVASCTLMIELGEQVFFSPGAQTNIKLTTEEDLDIFRALLAVLPKED